MKARESIGYHSRCSGKIGSDVKGKVLGTILEARTLLAKVLNVQLDTVGDKDSLYTLEMWDSLAHIRIILELEHVLNTELTTEQVLSVENVADIAKLLDSLYTNNALHG